MHNMPVSMYLIAWSLQLTRLKDSLALMLIYVTVQYLVAVSDAIQHVGQNWNRIVENGCISGQPEWDIRCICRTYSTMLRNTCSLCWINSYSIISDYSTGFCWYFELKSHTHTTLASISRCCKAASQWKYVRNSEIAKILQWKTDNISKLKELTWRDVNVINDTIVISKEGTVSDLSCLATFKRLVKTELYNRAYLRWFVTTRTYDSSICEWL